MSDAIVVRTRMESCTMIGSVLGGANLAGIQMNGKASSPMTGSPMAGSPLNVTIESKQSPPIKQNVARFGARHS